MQIKSIKTKDDGHNGLKVEHIRVIDKSGEAYDIACSDGYSHPISIDLETQLKKLRIHLLKLCRAWHSSWDSFIDLKTWDLTDAKLTDDTRSDYLLARSAIDDLIITGVTSDGEHFVIIGKTKSYDNANVNYISGCVHPSTEYPYYQEAIDTISDAYTATEEYITGEPESLIEKVSAETEAVEVAEDDQPAIEANEEKDGMDEERVSEPEEEKTAMHAITDDKLGMPFND